MKLSTNPINSNNNNNQKNNNPYEKNPTPSSSMFGVYNKLLNNPIKQKENDLPKKSSSLILSSNNNFNINYNNHNPEVHKNSELSLSSSNLNKINQINQIHQINSHKNLFQINKSDLLTHIKENENETNSYVYEQQNHQNSETIENNPNNPENSEVDLKMEDFTQIEQTFHRINTPLKMMGDPLKKSDLSLSGNEESLSCIWGISKNNGDLEKTDFCPYLTKYDNKIIRMLNNRYSYLEKKYLQAQGVFYKMENLFFNADKKKKESESRLLNNKNEYQTLKKNYIQAKKENLNLNKELKKSYKELEEIKSKIKENQEKMKEIKNEFDNNLLIKEKQREKLRRDITVNERQIDMLEERLNDNFFEEMETKTRSSRYSLIYAGNLNEEDIKKDEELQKLKRYVINLGNELNYLKNKNQKIFKKNQIMRNFVKFLETKEKIGEKDMKELNQNIEMFQKNEKIEINVIKNRNCMINCLKRDIAQKEGNYDKQFYGE